MDLAAQESAQAQASEQAEYVQGQQLEEQKTDVEETDIPTDYWLIAGFILLIFGYGFYRRDDEAPSM